MNKCYVFIGPSGSGKTSIANALFEPKEKLSLRRLVLLEKVKPIKKITIFSLKTNLSS